MYSTMPGGWGTATLNFAVGSDWGTYNTGTPALVVSSSGLTAAAFYYSSDLSLKKDIVPISNSLDKIEKLNGVYFNWKSNDEPSIGLIAQDVEKVFPQAVSTNSDTGLKSVDYGKLVAPLIEAVKTQQGQIDVLKASAMESNDYAKTLQTKINALENEVNELKSQNNEAD
jgi:dihydroorotase